MQLNTAAAQPLCVSREAHLSKGSNLKPDNWNDFQALPALKPHSFISSVMNRVKNVLITEEKEKFRQRMNWGLHQVVVYDQFWLFWMVLNMQSYFNRLIIKMLQLDMTSLTKQ